MLITKMIIVTMMDAMKQIWREICYCKNEGMNMLSLMVSYFQEYDVSSIPLVIFLFLFAYHVPSQVVELLLSLGKSERGLAITCLKSVLCWTGKRVCLVCKDFLIQNMDSATPYIEPLSIQKLIVMVSLFFIVIYYYFLYIILFICCLPIM
ncbi:hypothetical protein NC651_035550 [Populus alba x Populus x berolinensis]|nr:hypothetical protein NC651_035550 [Populus alba x Populus x berolinensis]